MLRHQNSHAIANAAFCGTFSASTLTAEDSLVGIFGADPPSKTTRDNDVDGRFAFELPSTVRALSQMRLGDEGALRQVLNTAEDELSRLPQNRVALSSVRSVESASSLAYPYSLIPGFIFRFVVEATTVILGEGALAPRVRSASSFPLFERPVSHGEQTYSSTPGRFIPLGNLFISSTDLHWVLFFVSSDTGQYPITEPLPKIEGKRQCLGEVQYSGDIPVEPGTCFREKKSAVVTLTWLSQVHFLALLCFPQLGMGN